MRWSERRPGGFCCRRGVGEGRLGEARGSSQQRAGRSDADVAAGLRRALANTLTGEVRRLAVGKRDVGRERSLEAALEQSSAGLGAWLAAEQSSPSQRM